MSLDDAFRRMLREELASALAGFRVPPLTYTVEQAADALGCSESTVRNLMRSGELRSYKIGSLTRISVDALRDYLARQEAA